MALDDEVRRARCVDGHGIIESTSCVIDSYHLLLFTQPRIVIQIDNDAGVVLCRMYVVLQWIIKVNHRSSGV